MTSPSEKILYHTIKVSYLRHKREVFSEEWAVTRQRNPEDIMMYDDHTMQRLRRKFYGNRKVKNKKVTIHEILDTVVLGRENNRDDKRGPDSGGL